MLAQVAGQREHRLGGADRVVEVPPGHLGAEPDLERRRQDLERPQLRRQHVHAAVLDALEGLPVERIQPGRPVRLLQCRRRRNSRSLSSRQLGERHRLVAGALGGGLLAEEEGPLLHEALQVILGGVAGVQLAQFRQELILERGLRRRHRPHVEADRRLLGAGIEGNAASATAARRTRVIAEYSRRQRSDGCVVCAPTRYFCTVTS